MGKTKDRKDLKGHTVHMIGNAHIDPVWLWRWTEGYEEVISTCRAAVDRLKETPEFVFTRGGAATYKWIEEGDPKLFEEIKRYVEEGRWNIVNGWWEQPDCNIPCSESFVRHSLYGKRYFKDKFGVDVKVGYNVDTFGHSAMLPQILKKSGLDYYVFFRPDPEEKALPASVFWWESPDGSRVLACRPPLHYGYGPDSPEVEDISRRMMAAYEAMQQGLKDVMCFYGVGNHGGGPTIRNIQTIKEMAARGGTPDFRFSTPDAFFAKVASQADSLPVVKEDLQYHSRGCYTAASEVKRHNRRTECLLLTAERFAWVARRRFGASYPQEDLNRSWQNVLFNQFHDILAGTCIKTAYDDVRGTYQEVYRLAGGALEDALKRIATQINTQGRGRALVVFNPSGWRRKDVVEAEVEVASSPESLTLTDSEGAEIPWQIVEREKKGGKNRIKFVFVADVPALGYRLYRLTSGGTKKKTASSLKVSKNAIENDFYTVELDPDAGHITRVYDKKSQVEALKGSGNVPIVIDDPSDTWSHGVNSFRNEVGRATAGGNIKVIERGPLRASVRVSSTFQNSSIQQEITLYNDLPRIDCRMTVDWHGRHLMLKVSFPVNVDGSIATYEIPYGNIVRPATGDEEPGQQWIDVGGQAVDSSGARIPYGLSLINDSKYGFDIKDADMRLSVLRSPIYAFHDPAVAEPGVNYLYTDQGEQTLSYSLIPHKGTWKEAGIARLGSDFNNPLIARFEPSHEGSLPPEASFVEVEPANVVLAAVKKSEDGDDLILRFYEMSGQETTAQIALPQENFSYKTPLGHYEIKTLRISFGAEGITVHEADLLENAIIAPGNY